jgi:hypothetical protein
MCQSYIIKCLLYSNKTKQNKKKKKSYIFHIVLYNMKSHKTSGKYKVSLRL